MWKDEEVEEETITFSNDTMPYKMGVYEGRKEVMEKLRMIGEALCIILDMLPSDEISIPIPISDKCKLLFTVRKI